MSGENKSPPVPLKRKLKKAQTEIRAFSLSLPEAVEELPWGHPAIKVRKRTFIFMCGEATESGKLSLSVKLPVSAEMVLELPFTKPTGYGLGHSGWITASFSLGDDVPTDML